MTQPTKPPPHNVQPMPGLSKRAQREAATRVLNVYSRAQAPEKK